MFQELGALPHSEYKILFSVLIVLNRSGDALGDLVPLGHHLHVHVVYEPLLRVGVGARVDEQVASGRVPVETVVVGAVFETPRLLQTICVIELFET